MLCTHHVGWVSKLGCHTVIFEIVQPHKVLAFILQLLHKSSYYSSNGVDVIAIAARQVDAPKLLPRLSLLNSKHRVVNVHYEREGSRRRTQCV
jgi:hypothetical protein